MMTVCISASPMVAGAAETEEIPAVGERQQITAEESAAEIRQETPTPEAVAAPSAAPTETPEEPEITAGWNSEEKEGTVRWFYYDTETQKRATGLFKADGKTYLADENGYLLTGAQTCKDSEGKSHTFYFSAQGEKPGKDSTYGAQVTGFAEDGKYYEPDLAADKFVEADGSVYYAGKDGVIAKNSLVEKDGSVYYAGEKGALSKNRFETVDGKTYYFGEDGSMYRQKGWLKLDKTYYYITEDGSRVEDQWLKEGIDWYYLNADGTMKADEFLEIGGDWYYFRSWGGMQYNAWYQDPGTKEYYYLRSWGGALNNGWNYIGGDYYWFDSDCTMAYSQWIQNGGNWYYVRSWGGRLHSQWFQEGIDWYYFQEDGRMMHDQWLTQDGKTYYFRSWGGRCHSGTFVIDGKSYTFDSNGVKKELQQVIVIDPGHQRHGDSKKEPVGPGSSVMKARVTSGTSGCVSGLDEYELNLQVSLLLRTELEKRGYKVYMTRETHDVSISNKERAEYATSVGGDILVRIHANSSDNSSVAGALCMAPSSSNAFVSALAPESQKLSQCVIDSYCQATGLKNRGVSITDDMSGINWSTMPVTIVEMGFMSNPGDDSKMADAGFQNKMVQGIADGIDQYFR